MDLDEEDAKTRERYGVYAAVSQGGGNGAEQGYARHVRGQNLLIARRLVEAGVPFINHHLLAIRFDPAQHIRDQLSRPWRLADGEPIKGLFSA